MKIGIPKDYFGEGLDEEVKKPILEAAEVLKNAGAEIEEFDLGLVKYAIPAYYVIASAEASSNLSRFDGVKYGYRTKDYQYRTWRSSLSSAKREVFRLHLSVKSGAGFRLPE